MKGNAVRSLRKVTGMIVDFLIELIKNIGFALLILVGLALFVGSFMVIIYGISVEKPWLSVIGGVVFILTLGIIITIMSY